MHFCGGHLSYSESIVMTLDMHVVLVSRDMELRSSWACKTSLQHGPGIHCIHRAPHLLKLEFASSIKLNNISLDWLCKEIRKLIMTYWLHLSGHIKEFKHLPKEFTMLSWARGRHKEWREACINKTQALAPVAFAHIGVWEIVRWCWIAPLQLWWLYSWLQSDSYLSHARGATSGSSSPELWRWMDFPARALSNWGGMSMTLLGNQQLLPIHCGSLVFRNGHVWQ